MEDDKIRFNWRDLFVKVLFLLVFFIILLLLYPNNNLSTFYDKVFNENVQTMKDAAKSYYTVDRLPSENGSSEKMTLAEMLDEKMILSFRDKDNRTCNEEKSYVEVTRLSAKEYALKVSLTCGKQTDHIMDTISYYGTCGDCGSNNDNTSSNNNNDNTSSSNNNDDNNVGDKDFDNDNKCTALEYEYQRTTTLEEFACPTGYTKVSNYCSKSTLLSRVNAKLITTPDKKIVTQANVNNGDSYKVYSDPMVDTKYICGSQYDNAGTYNVPTQCIASTSSTAPAEKKTTYTCGTGYTNAGTYTTYTKCYANGVNYTDAVAKTTYTCGSEYDNAGTYTVQTTCKKTVTTEAAATPKTTYTCSTAYDNAGTYTVQTMCYKTTRVTDPSTPIYATTYVCGSEYLNPGTYTTQVNCLKNTTETAPSTPITTTTYVCGSQYDNAGTYSSPTTCVDTVGATPSTTAGYYTSWKCGTCDVKRYTTVKTNTSTTKYDPQGTGYGYSCSTPSQCPNIVYLYYYIVYTRSWVAPVTTYSCPTGYIRNNQTCTYSIAATPSNATTYRCDDSYTNKGTYTTQVTCYKTVQKPFPSTPQTKTTYKCADGYANAGVYTVPTTCYKDTTITKPSEPKTTYTCSTAYDNAGTYNVQTTCKKVTVTSHTAVSKTTYTCDDRYLNAGVYNVPTRCVLTSQLTSEPTIDNKYVCDNSYDNAGTYNVPTTCTRANTITTPANPSTTYTCPTSYTESGTGSSKVCYKLQKNNDTYYCSDASSKLVGNTCEKTVKATSKYACESGYILSNKECYKYTNDFKEANQTECKETTEYIWSPTETLEGWVRTGETRNTDVRCPKIVDCLEDEGSTVCDPDYEAK